MLIGIGIDTGGTYTDAVVYDLEEDKILGSAKALTTRHDLSIGILEALDQLPREYAAKPDLVSLSTTLATNACVEDKTGRAKLVFFGGHTKTIDRHGGEYGLPPARDIYIQESHTTFSGEFLREVDWNGFRDRIGREIADLDGIGVIEMNSMRNGAVIEKKAKDLLASMTDIPVICGHELSMELSCLQRGAGTLLNASLFPIIKHFIAAIKKALAARGISAPIVIVRSDGSLMGEEFAALRPVETLLCGPAASVMGSVKLAGEKNCVIVDMGGTTTDIAVIRDGQPVRAENGISVGRWQTFVKGLSINTIGLGGDSAVHYNDDGLVLESYRVIPLCITGANHPGIIPQLAEQIKARPKHTRFLHEFFVPVKDIADSARYTDREKRFCEALRNGPLIRRQAALAVGQDEYTLDVARLLREGVVQVSGLTPTDIMHLRGDFSRYDAEASRLGAEFVAANIGVSVEELGEMVYGQVKRRMYLNVVKALLANEKPDYRRTGFEPGVEKLISESYDNARDGGNGFIRPSFRTDFALIGIGAPIHIFLGDVARLLGTRAVVPPHSEVANALGAIVGKIRTSREILIRPVYNLEGISRYTVHGDGEPRIFQKREEAEGFATNEAKKAARAEAIQRGAVGEITVSCTVDTQNAIALDSEMYLGSRAVAHAVGSITF